MKSPYRINENKHGLIGMDIAYIPERAYSKDIDVAVDLLERWILLINFQICGGRSMIKYILSGIQVSSIKLICYYSSNAHKAMTTCRY